MGDFAVPMAGLMGSRGARIVGEIRFGVSEGQRYMLGSSVGLGCTGTA